MIRQLLLIALFSVSALVVNAQFGVTTNDDVKKLVQDMGMDQNDSSSTSSREPVSTNTLLIESIKEKGTDRDSQTSSIGEQLSLIHI